jgi:hypothetical protein
MTMIREEAVFLGFGFVFAQSQVACEHAPSLSPRQKHQKSSLHMAAVFLQTL